MAASDDKKSVIFVPHGGGPLPLLGHESHSDLTAFLKQASTQLINPHTIIVVTAHWEADPIRISTAQQPSMLFDYGGFPPQTYQYNYPAPGNPTLANAMVDALNQNNIAATGDAKRGFDHGTFVPLMLMYPTADIPVVQMSLHPSLSPATHIQIGKVLATFVQQGALLVGSGLSFHNMNAFGVNADVTESRSKSFDHWLTQTLASPLEDAEKSLMEWNNAPEARFCHPREEHLLPLMVCFGAAAQLNKQLQPAYKGLLMNSYISGFSG